VILTNTLCIVPGTYFNSHPAAQLPRGMNDRPSEAALHPPPTVPCSYMQGSILFVCASIHHTSQHHKHKVRQLVELHCYHPTGPR